MSAAPAYAFKLALQQLCDPCDDVMSALQQMAQAINNIALDECGSAQALVNLGGDALTSMLGMDSQTSSSAFGNWVSDKANKLTAGFQAFNDEVRKLQNWQFCGGFANHEDYDRCARFINMEGSLWEKAKDTDRTSTNKPDEEFFRLARALFGEMIITAGQQGDKDNKSTTMYKVEYHAPCPTTTANLVIRNMLGNLCRQTRHGNGRHSEQLHPIRRAVRCSGQRGPFRAHRHLRERFPYRVQGRDFDRRQGHGCNRLPRPGNARKSAGIQARRNGHFSNQLRHAAQPTNDFG